MDLFVSNDTVANFLFINRGGGKFEEVGFQAESATARRAGHAQAWASIPPMSTRTDGWICLCQYRPRDVFPLPEPP